MAASGLADMEELPDPNTGFGTLTIERESLAAPGALAGTAAFRWDVAAPVITGQSFWKMVFKM